jgi:hypothetical protein
MEDEKPKGVQRVYRYRLRDAFRAMRAPAPTFGTSGDVPIPGREANRESVAWMLDQAVAHLEEQSARLDSLRLRAGQLAGFAGILLGLLASLASDGVSGLNGSAKYLATGALIASLVLLLAAVCLALFVVRPTKFREVSPAERIEDFLVTRSHFQAESWKLQLARLRTYPEVLRWHAWVNKRNAAALFFAYVALAGGLLASTISIATIGIRDGRSENAGWAHRGHSAGHWLGRQGRGGP